MEKTVGILGGMGPRATLDFMEKIINHTKASCDQEHIKMYIYNNTKVGNRIESINHTGIDITNELIKSAKQLEKMGADFLVMPCNTAHYYYNDIVQDINIPFYSIIDCAIDYLEKNNIQKIAIIGTSATIGTRLYHNKCDLHNISYLEYSEKIQDVFNDVIFSVKSESFSSEIIKRVQEALDFFHDQQAEAIVMACTEIPIFFKNNKFNAHLVDPTELLAMKTVEKAGYELR